MKSEASPRIAVFSKQLDAWKSGSGHHLHRVMSRILELNDQRPRHEQIEFTFIHYKKSTQPIYNRVREIIVSKNPFVSGAVLRKEKFDLVHYTPLTVFAPIFAVPNKKVATIHGVEQLLIPQFFGPVEMAHERILVPYYARRMDGIFSVSNTTKEYLVTRFSVNEERVAVAYNGIGEEYRPREAGNLPVLSALGISGPYVYHISRFSERKNPWTLLEAFAAFIAQGNGREHSLICAGSGWDNPELHQKAKSLGIADRLILPGFIPEKDSAELMSGADMFVFPSLAEGFGMPNAEAMAAGCPLVTSSVFAIPEVVGSAGIIIDDPKDASGFAQAMGKIADDRTFRKELINRGLERTSSGIFSWDRAARTLLNLYMRILKIDRTY